jgi:hypothetical protein
MSKFWNFFFAAVVFAPMAYATMAQASQIVA